MSYTHTAHGLFNRVAKSKVSITHNSTTHNSQKLSSVCQKNSNPGPVSSVGTHDPNILLLFSSENL